MSETKTEIAPDPRTCDDIRTEVRDHVQRNGWYCTRVVIDLPVPGDVRGGGSIAYLEWLDTTKRYVRDALLAIGLSPTHIELPHVTPPRNGSMYSLMEWSARGERP